MPSAEIAVPGGSLTTELLEVRNLTISYPAPAGSLKVVRDVSLRLRPAESLAVVGETGSGKTTLALALAGLLDSARIESGRILYQGMDLSSLGPGEWRSLRGRRLGFLFQDPRGALNPVLTIGSQLAEAIRAHQSVSRGEAERLARDLLAEVGVPDPAFYMRRYHFELSGGMCQRVGMALGLCNSPHILIADEPTSALDPSIQAQIVELLQQLRRRRGLALLLISHDLGLVAGLADRVAVMYGGRLLELGSAGEVLRAPAHPYTAALLECRPDLSRSCETARLPAIGGAPPAPGMESPGCPFADRCAHVEGRCRESMPPLVSLSAGHRAACIRCEATT